MAKEQRTQHPFHMYDAIMAQPTASAEVVAANGETIAALAAMLATRERLFLVGIGTSHHATQVGYHLFRTLGGQMPTQVWHSFDFALYGPQLTEHDAVLAVSHRGNKRYTLAALDAARAAGCYTALITGEGETEATRRADCVLRTIAQEGSSAHTISHTTAVALLAALADAVGAQRSGAHALPDGFLTRELPEALRAALSDEETPCALAHEYLGRRAIRLVSGGPGEITAREIALKIRETAYLQAEGMGVETMLHGPFQCAEADDLFILIAPAGQAQQRVMELTGPVRAIGAACLVVSDGSLAAAEVGDAAQCAVPSIAEPFTALTCLMPLQLFTYHLALAKGTNPDGFRLDDPHFARAWPLMRL